MSYSFPMQDSNRLVQVLVSWELDCNENDFKQPKRERWQPMYTSMLGFALGTDENDMANNLLQTQFECINNVEYPKVHEEAMPLFNLCRAMQRVLFSCGVEDFSIMDIIEPKPRRLIRIISGLINYINFRSERMNTYDRIKEEDANQRNHKEILMEENDELQTNINAIKATRAKQEPELKLEEEKMQQVTRDLEERRNTIAQLQKEMVNTKASLAEKKAQLSRVKETVAVKKEEEIRLSSQIAQSPERMKGEKDRMQKLLSNLELDNQDKQANLNEHQAKRDALAQHTEDIESALTLIRAVQDSVEKEKEKCESINKLHNQGVQQMEEVKQLRQKNEQIKRMIDITQGKLSKQHLLNTSRMEDFRERLQPLEKKKDQILQILGEIEVCLSEELNEKDRLLEQEHPVAQKHQDRMTMVKEKYRALLTHVDIYHTNLGETWDRCKQQMNGAAKTD